MNFADRKYTDIVRDLLTVLTGGTAGQAIPIGSTVPDLIPLDQPPVRRVSYLQGKIAAGEKLLDYQFTERDFELVGTDQNPSQKMAIRFRPKGNQPAPNTVLTVNFFPERLGPTPLTDVSVGSVIRTLLETASREIATQYVQLQLVYESAFVETARGESLDRVAAIVDTRRLRQGHAVGKVRLSRRSGSPGSITIPINTAVSDGEGNRYLTTDEVTLLPNQATVEVWVRGENPRVKPASPNTLNVLEQALAGIDRVNNDEPTYRATDDESDEQFRARARRAIHATGKGTPDALRNGLEGLPFVSAVTLSEYPDIPVPGMVRVDVALSIDNEWNRRLVDRRIDELRPAGIYVDRQWAGKVTLAFRVQLVLVGAPLPTSTEADVRDALAERLSGYARDLGPGDTLRRARLVSLALEDDRVLDARIEFTADGAVMAGETWTLPAGKAAALDATQPVTFGPITYEDAPGDGPPVMVQIDADLEVTALTVMQSAFEASRKQALENFVAGLHPGDQVTFDQLATALRDDTQGVLVRTRCVFAFDQEGGGFTELRESDPAFIVPVGSTLRVRALRVKEVTP